MCVSDGEGGAVRQPPSPLEQSLECAAVGSEAGSYSKRIDFCITQL